jgi:peptidoglycan/xylan/chitin deacetylase (PgdA/CDA1 family)
MVVAVLEHRMNRIAYMTAVLLAAATGPLRASAEPVQVPILAYRSFGPVASDSLTVSTRVLDSQLRHLREHGYTVIPLGQFVDYRRGKAPAPPPRAVVITVDEGDRTVYTDMLPLVRRYGVPVTLFVYSSTVSRAGYALSWEQLTELVGSGLFDVQAHAYWYEGPRGTHEPGTAPVQFLVNQLIWSRRMIQSRLSTPVNVLAWPWDVHDCELRAQAEAVGYVAGVTLEPRHATASDDPMALPRYPVRDGDTGPRFERLLSGAVSTP